MGEMARCIFCNSSDYFALAKNHAALHIEQAFQASSPKNFQGWLSGWPFFCPARL
jgi:hypothetical protein